MSNSPIEQTQGFFNMSAEYFDRLPSVERYSYFGSFRSDVSNVGPNAAMLTQKGELTDIGSWYLGGAATGKVGKAGNGKSAASTEVVAVGWVVSVAAVIAGLMAL